MAQVLEVVSRDGPPPVWPALRAEAERAARAEPGLASLINAAILAH